MSEEIVTKDKLVELTYKVVDHKSGEVLTAVEFPVAYVHGSESVLSEEATREIEGKSVGDIIEVPIDTDLLYGKRDESLVFIDHIDNVPEEFREVGLTITMENDKGESKNFIVTRVDEKSVTVDGNNPLCGRDVIFKLEIMLIRDATDEEIALGGRADAEPSLEEILNNAET